MSLWSHKILHITQSCSKLFKMLCLGEVFFLVKLSVLWHLLTAKQVYYIKSDTYNCTATEEMLKSCYPLQRLGEVLSSTNETSVTVLLLPGKHVIPENKTLRIYDFNKFSIIPWEKYQEVLIQCRANATINFHNIIELNMSFLHFIFCSFEIVYERVGMNKSAYIKGNIFEQSSGSYAVQVLDYTDSEVLINVTFTKCTFLLNTGAIYVKYIIQTFSFSEEILSRGKVVVISDTLFQRNYNNLQGVVHLENTLLQSFRNQFSNNKGSSMKAYFSNLYISTTLFENNTALNSGSSLDSLSCSLYLAFCHFINNSDVNTGTVTVRFGLPPIASASIAHCTFIGNRALSNGGAMFIEGVMTSIFQCYFHDNSATSGGAIYVSLRNQNVYISNSTFLFNQACKDGGALYCNNNGAMFLNTGGVFSSNSASDRGGFVYLSNCDLNILIRTFIIRNNKAFKGGAVYAASSDVALQTETLIANNTAEESGGGLYLVNSKLYTTFSNRFIHNVVTSNTGKGGAIFILDENCNTVSYPLRCFLTTSTSLIFINNSANAGAVLYGGLLDRCLIVYESNIIQGIEFFRAIAQYEPTQSAVSSDPSRVCLCIDGTVRCDKRNMTLKTVRGQEFAMWGIVVDQDQNPKASFIAAGYVEPEAKLGEGEGRKKTGNKTCVVLSYHIFSTNTSATLILRPEGFCERSDFSSITISISLQPCRRGWERNGDRCVCERRLKYFNISSCNISADSVKRERSIWLRYDEQYLKGHTHCPLDYCNVTSDTISLARPDEQCAHYRSGVLCGACQEGYSIALGGSKCLQCTSNYAFLWLLPLFAVAGIALVALLLVCNLTVSHGTLNGLIFYANVVSVSGLTNLQNCSIHPVLSVFISWVNLDFGVETCFYSGMDTYQRVWLQLAFPFYMWLMVGIIILACHYSSTAVKIFGSNNIAILATLFLLSYTKILTTIIAAITFTEVLESEADNVSAELIPYKVWTYDGNIKYLNGKHIPMFLVAILLLIFLFIPYTLSLTFGQYFRSMRTGNKYVLRCIRSIVFISVMDAYHAPYNKKHRYWTGLLLILRCVLFLSFTIFYGRNKLLNNLYITSLIVTIILALKVFIKTTYKNVFLNFLEVFFFLNLLTLSTTLCYLISSSNGDIKVCKITNSSVSVAIFMFGGIMVYHVYIKIKTTFFKYKKKKINAKLLIDELGRDKRRLSERELRLLD